MKYWPVAAARTAEILVGLTYVVAAVLKVLDFNGFLPQIYAYQIVASNTSLLVVAFAALALETGLGACMILGAPFRRVVLGLGAAMLCFFTAVIIYAWQVHGLEDCGCFGKVKFTPPQAIGKNMILLALTAFAYYGLVRGKDSQTPVRGGVLRTATGGILALVLCLSVIPQIMASPESAEPGLLSSEGGTPKAESTGLFAGYVVTSEFGESYDLGIGEYLVAILSMDCAHCMDSVPQLNEFVFDTTLPPLVALCFEPEAGSMEEFEAITQPQFPMHSFGDKSLTLFSLLENDTTPPRLVYIRDGATVRSWDDEVPDYQTLFSELHDTGFPVTEN